jgi:hypothetical protein
VPVHSTVHSAQEHSRQLRCPAFEPECLGTVLVVHEPAQVCLDLDHGTWVQTVTRGGTSTIFIYSCRSPASQ